MDSFSSQFNSVVDKSVKLLSDSKKSDDKAVMGVADATANVSASDSLRAFSPDKDSVAKNREGQDVIKPIEGDK